MADIFLSYARTDVERAKQIAEALETKGWSVWWDAALRPGEVFREKIVAELQAARCVVVLWSTASLASHWVIDEAEDGKKRRILVQALIEEVQPPHGFRQIQAARLIGWDGGDSGEFSRLCAGISTFASRSRSPEKPQAPQAQHSPGLTLSEQWRLLKRRFTEVGHSSLQASREPNGLDAPLKVFLADYDRWRITGPESSKVQFQILAEEAGRLLKESGEYGMFGFKTGINLWLSFVDWRGTGGGRIDDLIKASTDACAYCANAAAKR